MRAPDLAVLFEFFGVLVFCQTQIGAGFRNELAGFGVGKFMATHHAIHERRW